MSLLLLATESILRLSQGGRRRESNESAPRDPRKLKPYESPSMSRRHITLLHSFRWGILVQEAVNVLTARDSESELRERQNRYSTSIHGNRPRFAASSPSVLRLSQCVVFFFLSSLPLLAELTIALIFSDPPGYVCKGAGESGGTGDREQDQEAPYRNCS